jgi:hypothetical protein
MSIVTDAWSIYSLPVGGFGNKKVILRYLSESSDSIKQVNSEQGVRATYLSTRMKAFQLSSVGDSLSSVGPSTVQRATNLLFGKLKIY